MAKKQKENENNNKNTSRSNLTSKLTVTFFIKKMTEVPKEFLVGLEYEKLIDSVGKCALFPFH
jgi:hypothetical protein